MLERRGAVTVGDVHVSAGLDEQTDDFQVLRPAPAEDDRLQKGRPAEAVDVVDLDVGLEEPADNLA